MHAATLRPPPLPRWQWRPLRPGELDHEALWPGVSLGAALFGLGWLHAGLPFPPCPFKTVTGCPCLTCGATRAAFRLLQGDLAGAFAFNPLVVLIGAGIGIYNLYAIAVVLLRSPRLRPLALPAATGPAARWLAIAAIVVNWGWVIRHGN